MTNVGVIGHPIGHSLSPILHSRWMERYGISAQYDAIDGMDEETFLRVVQDNRRAGWAGMNVTAPFKNLTIGLSQHVSERAEAIGTANLLVFNEDGISADNTDGVGFASALQAAGTIAHGGTAAVLGAGGAAPAILWALQSTGIQNIALINRTFERAERLAMQWPGVKAVAWEARSAAIAEASVMVNTTSLGMTGQAPLDIDPDALPTGGTVVDISTTPLKTPLLLAAEARGCVIQNGLPMLVHQAIPSFEAWFGITPDDADDAIAFLTNVLAGRS